MFVVRRWWWEKVNKGTIQSQKHQSLKDANKPVTFRLITYNNEIPTNMIKPTNMMKLKYYEYSCP